MPMSHRSPYPGIPAWLKIFGVIVITLLLLATILIATHDQDLVARSGRPSLHLEAGRLSPRPPQGPTLS